MSNPADKQPPVPADEADPLNSTVEMPPMKIVPDLSVPPDTVLMPPIMRPKTPATGEAGEDKK